MGWEVFIGTINARIIAMIVNALLAWGIERIVWVIFYCLHGSLLGVTETTTSEDYGEQIHGRREDGH
jgi:hypothetical protein